MTDADRLRAFVRAYLRLRQLQRHYFKSNKDPASLAAAKTAERELDAEATAIINFTTPSLFDQGGEGGGHGDGTPAGV